MLQKEPLLMHSVMPQFLPCTLLASFFGVPTVDENTKINFPQKNNLIFLAKNTWNTLIS